jgi:LysR family glycine cleavage system transcriptional activator
MNKKNLTISHKLKPLRNLSGLLDFECAARLMSFKLAAFELHKTPAAISLQIKQLEESLGFKLFVRHPRHITITEKGFELARNVTRLISDLQTKIKDLQGSNEELILRITTTHSFAIKWLASRIHLFTENYPQFDVRIESNDQLVNLSDLYCDIAIRYSPRLSSDLQTLCNDYLVLVYSPDWLSKKSMNEKKLSVNDLSKYPLLYEDTTENWLQMLKINNIVNKNLHFAHSYSHSGLLVQAAVAGQGIAIVPHTMAYEDILKGRLNILSCKPLLSKYCYRILYDNNKENMPKIIAFKKWIMANMEDMNRFFSKFKMD